MYIEKILSVVEEKNATHKNNRLITIPSDC